MRAWSDEGFDLAVSVNLSARQFAQPDLVGQVATTLEATGLHPNGLILEIVETLAKSRDSARRIDP